VSLAEWIAGELGGARKVGKAWRCRCPSHDDHHPSLDIVDRDDDILWICRAGCDGSEIGRELYRRGLRPHLGGDGESVTARAPRKQVPAANPDRAKLDWLLSQLRPIEKTPVATYLGTRGLDLPPAGHHLRYLPANPPKFTWPCMVGIITAFDDVERIQSLHFTRLQPDGLGKAPLRMQQRSYLKGFSKKGGVIRLCGDAEVTQTLGLGEGIETSLAVNTSFRRAGWDQPVWAALDAGNMGYLPVVPGIDTLFIYADRGQAGEKAADKLAQCWLAAGRDVFVSTAPVDDWNSAVAP
jgi:hypothetical protein